MKRAMQLTILMAEDDADDRALTQEAMDLTAHGKGVRFVADGEELMDYLRHRGAYVEDGSSPRPAIILLDLNMPKLDGREALASIKADASLRNIPVVVLSTSSLPRDIDDSYDLGASSFITKPVTFGELEGLVKNLMRYWFETVALPVPAGAAP